MKSSQIVPHINGQLIFKRYFKEIQWETKSFQQMELRQVKPQPFPSTTCKINK